ncbi:MAG: divalent-cation tolerance protein CutA [Elusimicrobiales bacterium]|jgi:periplasmic divalent cation tolerance protein
MPSPYAVCLVTAGDEKTASSIAGGLVEGKLAACVSMIGGVASTYRWKGKVETAGEVLLVIKTRKSLVEDVEQFVKRNHPSSVPEILFMSVEHGSRDYLDWLGANTLFTTNISKDKAGKITT